MNITEQYNIYSELNNLYNIKCMGIYIIKINNIYYIGETLDYNNRLQTHINDLLNNRHHNKKLQKEFNLDKNINNVFCIIDKKYCMINNGENKLISNIVLLYYEKYIIKNCNYRIANIEHSYDKIYNKASNALKELMDFIKYIIDINIDLYNITDVFKCVLESVNDIFFIDNNLEKEFNKLRQMKP